MKRAALKLSAALEEAAVQPTLTVVKPMMGPYLTYQQEQYIKQREMLEEAIRTAPPRVPSWSEMYPKLKL